MSESITPIDLSVIPLNGTGRIDLSGIKTAYINPSEQALAHIRIYNESGSILSVRSDSGTLQDYIPAGAWPTFSIGHDVQAINFSVISILPNPPIQLLMATYFSPGEEVPPVPQLGNSPVGIGGTVPLNASSTAVANDNNPSGTEYIESSVGGVKDFSGLNQGIFQFLRALTGANQEYIRFNPNDQPTFKWSIVVDTSGNLLIVDENVGKKQGIFSPNGGGIGGAFGIPCGGWSKFSGAGSGNFNHGLGITPTHVDPCQSIVGSQTMGYSAPNATNVNIVAGAGNNFTAMAFNI